MDWLQELSLNSLALLTFLSWYFSYTKHNVSDLAYNLVVHLCVMLITKKTGRNTIIRRIMLDSI